MVGIKNVFIFKKEKSVYFDDTDAAHSSMYISLGVFI